MVRRGQLDHLGRFCSHLPICERLDSDDVADDVAPSLDDLSDKFLPDHPEGYWAKKVTSRILFVIPLLPLAQILGAPCLPSSFRTWAKPCREAGPA